eukprot:6646701-Lingulodinium_polyedra.AAC.1
MTRRVATHHRYPSPAIPPLTTTPWNSWSTDWSGLDSFGTDSRKARHLKALPALNSVRASPMPAPPWHINSSGSSRSTSTILPRQVNVPKFPQ